MLSNSYKIAAIVEDKSLEFTKHPHITLDLIGVTELEAAVSRLKEVIGIKYGPSDLNGTK